MEQLKSLAGNQHFDLVLSHTCPYSYLPTDLFLPMVDQSTVDHTMEKWMDELADNITFGVWCWGHFHADRIEAPNREMFYQEVENLEDIENRWLKYDETGELGWWLPLSPGMEVK